uniref:Uncharacterized protein n=1 Tax=Tetranychus urticae TaxID=32264 RepID=T1K255_TETUR
MDKGKDERVWANQSEKLVLVVKSSMVVNCKH